MKFLLATSLTAFLARQSLATVQDTTCCASHDEDLEVCTFSSNIRTRKTHEARAPPKETSRQLTYSLFTTDPALSATSNCSCNPPVPSNGYGYAYAFLMSYNGAAPECVIGVSTVTTATVVMTNMDQLALNVGCNDLYTTGYSDMGVDIVPGGPWQVKFWDVKEYSNGGLVTCCKPCPSTMSTSSSGGASTSSYSTYSTYTTTGQGSGKSAKGGSTYTVSSTSTTVNQDQYFSYYQAYCGTTTTTASVPAPPVTNAPTPPPTLAPVPIPTQPPVTLPPVTMPPVTMPPVTMPPVATPPPTPVVTSPPQAVMSCPACCVNGVNPNYIPYGCPECPVCSNPVGPMSLGYRYLEEMFEEGDM